MKVFLNIIRIIIAFFLSILLFTTLICTPIISSISAFMQKDTVQEVIENIDFVEIIKSDEETLNELQKNGVSLELMEKVLNLNVVDELLELYISDLYAGLEGTVINNFTSENIKVVVDENIDELIVFVKDMIKEEYPTYELDDAEAKDLVYQLADELVKEIPNVNQLGIFSENATADVKDSIETIRLIYEGTVFIPFVGIAIILSILILLLRLNNFEGFMWLGINYCTPAGIILSLSSGLKGEIDLSSLDIPSELNGVISSSFEMFATKLTTAGFVLAGCGALFLLIFMLGRNLKNNKKSEIEVL